MSIEFSLDTNGFDRWMDQLAASAVPAVARGMHVKGELTMTRSKADFVPIDTGALRASGNVETKVEGSVVQTTLGYGGPAVNYAVPVHETNKNYKGGRQWQYLATPLKEDLPGYSESVATELNKAFQ